MERVLLDTHNLIWALGKPEELSKKARHLLQMQSVEVFVSVASLWEIANKCASGKLTFEYDHEDLVNNVFPFNGFQLLMVEPSHTQELSSLAFPTNGHADPFDRMIVAQAIVERLSLVSADGKLDEYPVLLIR